MDKQEKQRGSLFLRLEERPRLRLAVGAALILVMTILQCLQLDLSSGVRFASLLSRRWVYFFVNTALVFIIDLFFLLITRRWHAAYILGSIFVCVWSVANHYTKLFSGDILTLSAMQSIGTAMNVLGGYRLSLDRDVVPLIVGCVVCIALSLAVRRLVRPIPWRRLWVVLCTAAAIGGACAGSLTMLIRSDESAWWNLKLDVRRYGYPVYFVRNAAALARQSIQPAGYDSGLVDALAAEVPAASEAAPAGQSAPDIFLILNETYYDLDHYTPVEADMPYMDGWSSMENAIRGYAVVPESGGGTNKSEYELLTSNSMYLLACQAPFNTMDLSDANGIARYLQALGYESRWALHSYSSADYNRKISYPALGFTNILFDERFSYSHYGDRYMLDSSNYQDLFSLYMTCTDSPQFMYLLTFQNHGGYEQNDDSMDTVHTGRDFGELTDDVNEFLTSIKMSSDALYRLTSYFNSVERPVIVCMVGDHAPSFINELPPREGMTEQEQDVVKRSTPFFIWANDAFGAIEAGDVGTVSLTDLVPMMLKTAGMPLSAYYQAILDLSEQIPVRLSTGLYRTAGGAYGQFAPDDERYDLLSPYYFMEYDNLQSADERRQVLFEP